MHQLKSFAKVAARYGLSTPEQVKHRILWNNVRAIVAHLYRSDESDKNQKILEQYDTDWIEAEKAERKKKKGR